MASAALTVIFGSPGLWYGGHAALTSNPDPSHAIQGIVTGIGFLGAGVIMREETLRKIALERGYKIPTGSISINCDGGKPEWHYMAVATNAKKCV